MNNSMNNLLDDLRYSVRQLRRSPGFTFSTVATLTLAIAANVVVFGVVDALLLHPLPVPQPGRIYQVEKKHAGGGIAISYPDYRDMRDRNQTFSTLAVTRLARIGMGVNGTTEPVWGYEVSGNYFETLGVQPMLGRFISAADDIKVNGSPVAVLSFDSWRVRFNADPSIIGKTVLISKHPYTVIGVAPRDFAGTERFIWPDVWLPYHNVPEIEGNRWVLEQRGNSGSWVIGRLRDGISVETANADLNRVALQMAKEFPDQDKGLSLHLSKPGLLGDMLGQPVKTFMAGVMGLAALVLLAACANLGSLFSSRMTDRARELGIRLAIGATRTRIVRQLLTESILVALASGAAASMGSAALLNALARWRPAFGELPIHFLVQPHWSVFLFAALIALTTGLIFGMIPARQVWLADPNQTLKSAGSTASYTRSPLRSILLTVQIALCCLLVTASFVAVRGLQRTFDLPFGFDPKGVTIASMDVHLAGYDDDAQAQVQQKLLAAVTAIPGVSESAYANSTPLSIDSSTTSIYAPGTSEFSAANARFHAVAYSVSPTYFHAAGTPLLAGRTFTAHDDSKSPAVAIVNETFVKRLFGVARSADAVGKRFPDGPHSEIEVVGVVADGKYETLTEDQKPAFFRPIAQNTSSQTVLLVRSQRDPAEIASAMRQAISLVDPGMPVFNIAAWPNALGLMTFPARAATIALGVLGTLAIVLAITGIFGLASFTVSRRMRELGIRVALGAQGRQVLRAALGRIVILLCIGSLIGLGTGFAASRLLAGIVYHANASDPFVMIAVAVTMAALGVVASALPARRALRIEPVVLLREE